MEPFLDFYLTEKKDSIASAFPVNFEKVLTGGLGSSFSAPFLITLQSKTLNVKTLVKE